MLDVFKGPCAGGAARLARANLGAPGIDALGEQRSGVASVAFRYGAAIDLGEGPLRQVEHAVLVDLAGGADADDPPREGAEELRVAEICARAAGQTKQEGGCSGNGPPP